jgi:photosystem II stability/assembly factor-like uncharacterized protein
MPKLVKLSLTLIFTTILLLGFAVAVNPPNGTWYQQFFPNLNGRTISDITFVDSLTGYAVTRYTSPDTNYILKTTDKGDSWSIVHKRPTSHNFPFTKVKCLNKDTGFVCGNALLKTTNAGMNWIPLNIPALNQAIDMHVLNEDTIWFADDIDIDGGLFRTTDKGNSWEKIYGGTANNPVRIYMYNARIGFMYTSQAGPLWKTTNGGYNWFSQTGGVYMDIQFIDSLTGWKANGDMKKTTDGGLNWITQTLPFGGIIITSSIGRFTVLNQDTIWGGGGQVFYGSGVFRGMLYRTTNGGNNWLFQVPDTSFGILGFGTVRFLNKNTGWVLGSTQGIPRLIHTTNGGDTTFLVGLQQVSSEVPNNFRLFQNYPNPFNPVTNIKYSLKRQTSNWLFMIYQEEK